MSRAAQLSNLDTQRTAIWDGVASLRSRAEVAITGCSNEASKLHAVATMMTAVAPVGHAVATQNAEVIATVRADPTPVSAASTGSDQSRQALRGTGA
jgi:hypothetical protein